MRRVLTLGAVILVVAIAAAAVLWLSAARPIGTAGGSAPGTTAETDDEGVPTRPAGAFRLTVLYVYDGDTIRAQMQSPNDIVTTARPIRIRLIGIDTPEGTPEPECWAEEARNHLAELLPEGATVWAAPDQDTWDDYNRRLFNLWTDDGRFLNHELVTAGDAEAIRVWPNVAHDDVLVAAQAEAQAAQRGQWGACG
jgi:endonuclease YncB( thermonuclease family)